MSPAWYSLTKQTVALPLRVTRTLFGEAEMASSGLVMQSSIAVEGNEGYAGENTESSNSRPGASIPPALPSL
jgi:hypothetical protein